MTDFDKILSLANESDINEGLELPKIKLHKWLVLGQTDFVCENGTLSEGHEKLIDSQVYPQAIKEMYYLCVNIKHQEVQAKRAQADLLDAQDLPEVTAAQKLRKEAAIAEANLRLMQALTTIEDQSRMVRFYKRKVDELAPKVEAKYPGGLEQAERDNWKAVAHYRKLRQLAGIPERFDNVVLSAEDKAEIGVDTNSPALAAWLAVRKEAERNAELTSTGCLNSLGEISKSNTDRKIVSLVKQNL